MTFTSLSPVAVGQKIRAVLANAWITAIGELQTLATKAQFTQSKAAFAWTTGADTSFAAWTASGGYTVSGTGLAVPSAGVYLVTLRANKTANNWSTRAHLSCTVGAVVYRTSIDAGVGEDNACLSFVTDAITAGTVITARYYSGTAVTAAATLNIVKLPVD